MHSNSYFHKKARTNTPSICVSKIANNFKQSKPTPKILIETHENSCDLKDNFKSRE